MDAGHLSERLTIQAVTSTSDGQGGTSASAPSTVATVWAEPIPLSAGEQLQAESVGSHALYRFRIRVRSDVRASQTVLWTPRWPASHPTMTLQILGVQPEPNRQGMVLSCAVVQ